MKYFVYLSEDCTKDAIGLGFRNELEKLGKKVEEDQSIASWDLFLPFPIVKKNLGKTGRLIAIKHLINDDIVVCFMNLLSRGDRRYLRFIENHNDYYDRISLDIEEVKKIYFNKVKSNNIIEPPRPSDEEYEYLYNKLCPLDTSDGIIYESRDWVKLINESDISIYKSRYYDIIKGKVLSSDYPDDDFIQQNGNVKIILKKFTDQNIIFLIAPLLKEQDEKDYLEKYSDILDLKKNVLKENIIQESRKSYPALILAEDEKIWNSIEENKEGNLALSPQESNLLDSIRHPDAEGKVFPLFINGHPGSGKTTILQYLFSEYLYLHLLSLIHI